MKIVTVIGHFGFGKELLNGQTVKTRIIFEALKKRLGETEIVTADTHGGWRTLLKAPFQALRALATSRNVVILPARNGVCIYGTLLPIIRPLFSKRKLHYVVIGGWLPIFLEKRKWLSKQLKKFDGIYVETRAMQRALEEKNFSNIVWMPNCKELTVLPPDQLVYSDSEPYRLCTFSRVSREKGIADAVEIVRSVNEYLGRTVCTLDIYGQIDPDQQQWFGELQNQFSSSTRYCGMVPYDRSVEVLKDYYALLFPTHSYTEGIPGTIIDAYAAGLPVIAAKWEGFSDIIDENRLGQGYAIGNNVELHNCVIEAIQNPKRWNAMRLNCLMEAEQYKPEKVIQILTTRLEGE